MKKIISTLAFATLAFGSVFADVKISANYRTQANAFSRVMAAHDEAGKAQSDAEKVRANSYFFSQKAGAYGGHADSLKISGSNDFGGVTFEINPNAATGKVSAFKQYNAFVKLGDFKLAAGRWQDGVMPGDYQLKKDADNSNLGGESFAAYKLGSLHGGAITVQSNDLCYFDGNSHIGYIEYAADIGDMKLTADVVAASTKSTAWDGSDVYSGFGFQLDAKFDTWDFQFTFKQPDIKDASSKRVVAFYAQPTFGNLKATFGGAAGYIKGELSEFNTDIRFRYVSGPLSIANFNNISYMTDFGKTYYHGNKDGDYVKHVGAVFLDNAGALAYAKNTWSQSAMWNLVSVNYALSEKLTIIFNVGDLIGFNAGGKEMGDLGMELFAAPAVQVFAGKGASLTTALRVGMSNLLLDSDKHKDAYGNGVKPTLAVCVPVVFRVKF